MLCVPLWLEDFSILILCLLHILTVTVIHWDLMFQMCGKNLEPILEGLQTRIEQYDSDQAEP